MKGRFYSVLGPILGARPGKGKRNLRAGNPFRDSEEASTAFPGQDVWGNSAKRSRLRGGKVLVKKAAGLSSERRADRSAFDFEKKGTVSEKKELWQGLKVGTHFRDVRWGRSPK